MVDVKMSFRLNIDDIPISLVEAVVTALDQQIIDWNTAYPALDFKRNEISFTEIPEE